VNQKEVGGSQEKQWADTEATVVWGKIKILKKIEKLGRGRKTIITLYEATWHHIPEDIIFVVTTMRTSNLRHSSDG
jgi:hypothetical protein